MLPWASLGVTRHLIFEKVSLLHISAWNPRPGSLRAFEISPMVNLDEGSDDVKLSTIAEVKGVHDDSGRVESAGAGSVTDPSCIESYWAMTPQSLAVSVWKRL